MGRFRYRMQSILDIKMKLEESAKQVYSEKKLLYDQEEKKLLQLKQRKAGYEEESRQLLQGMLDFLKIEENRNAILNMDGLIRDQQVAVNRAFQEVERARNELEDIVKDRKVQESLRDKAFEDFLEEEKHAESKEVDELTSYIYGKKTLNN